MNLVKKYLITIGASLLAILVIICAKDIFVQTEAARVLHILVDAFFAIGVVLTGFGLLIFSSNEGVFDGLVYGVGCFIDMFKRTGKRKYATFYDYKQSRGGSKFGFGFLVISGLALLAISFVLLIIYKQYV